MNEANRLANAQLEIEASDEALSAAEALLEHGLLRSAVSRLYYSKVLAHLQKFREQRDRPDARTGYAPPGVLPSRNAWALASRSRAFLKVRRFTAFS